MERDRWEPSIPYHDFVNPSAHVRLIRTYAIIILCYIAVFIGGLSFFISSDQNKLAQTIQAEVLESSRPLDDVSKAPVDWTGDGKADGWAWGEYLPGDTAEVHLNQEGKSYRPTTAFEYVFLISLGLLVYGGLGVFLLMVFDGFLSNRAIKAAVKDWKKAHQYQQKQAEKVTAQ